MTGGVNIPDNLRGLLALILTGMIGVSTAQRLLNYRRQAFCHRSVTFLTECHKMCLDVIPRCTGDFTILSIKTLLRNPFAQM